MTEPMVVHRAITGHQQETVAARRVTVVSGPRQTSSSSPAESPDRLTSVEDVSALLERWSGGDRRALDRLMPLIYDELRALAHRQLSGERHDHTLQTTALVHEAYLRLGGQSRADWANRRQFMLVAATMMRRVLVDYARRRAAAKRPPPGSRVAIEEVSPATGFDLDVLALDEALNHLSELDPRQAQVVELRYFTGLSIEETARTLDLSVSTVTREWRMARAWLHRELTGAPSSASHVGRGSAGTP